MCKLKIIILLFLLFSFRLCLADLVYSKKETLYSTKSGSPIGDLLLSIESKSASVNNNEWLLIIGDKGSNFFDSRNEKTLWIFNKKFDANSFKKDLRNRDYPVEVKDLVEFMPFCENGIRFDIKDWDELSKQTRISFFINASPGQKISLRLVFYTSSQDKKRKTIDDEAKVKIEFEIPDPVVVAKQIKAAQEAELISLTEKIDYEAAAKQKEAQREDSLLQAETEKHGKRITLLSSFIMERSREMSDLQDEVNKLLKNTKSKVDASRIDSLESLADELKKKVDYWENGYSDILLTNEFIHDKFSKFGIAHAITLKKIVELRQQQNPFNNLISWIKKNLLMSIGIGVGGLIFLKIFISLLGKLKAKLKSSVNQKISMMKSKAKKQVREKPKKWTRKKKKETDDEFENIDINDLAEI